ncbi:GNAT family N-acetyltransferase [Clostridium algidicarnis]|uniref:GNAT family N-acetyltransferase n=1 Tax=Clostridium algidicarnis TaxID=37659 RepID=UPI003FD82C27
MDNIFYIDVDNNLKLKLLLNNDKEVFFDLINNNRKYLEEFMPRIIENKSIEDTEKVIEIFLEQLKQNNGFRSGIIYKGKLIGIIGLKYIDWINRKTEIMYWIDKKNVGKGISTKCTDKVLELVFNYYDLNKAILKMSPNNKGSIRIAEKCGFSLEGICREDELLLSGFTDLNIYSILKSDYRGR